MVGLMGQDLYISGNVNMPTFTPTATAPTGLLGFAGVFLTNILFFFSLMGMSTTWFLFGTVIVTPFIIGVGWVLVDILKDLVPFT